MTDHMTGAVGSARGHSVISKAIIFFQRLQERPGWNPFVLGKASKSHTYLYKTKSLIIESQAFQGVRQKPAFEYAKREISVYRPKFLTETVLRNMYILAGFLVGDSYGYSKLPLLALDGIFRTYKFSKYGGITSFKVCTHIIGWLYQKVPVVETTSIDLYKIYQGKYDHPKELNYKFGRKWQSLNPDICEDWMQGHVEWEKIR